MLKAHEAALGRRIDTGDLARLASPGATALGRPHPEDPAHALDRIERDLALVSSGQPGVARHLAQPDSFLVRSLQQERAGWDASLTPWDGIVDVAGAGEASARLRLAGQRSSASVVETFAGCPYRHFLKTGLRLRAWEEPERAYQAEPKDFGSLYHSVAHRFFAELQEQHQLPLAPDAPDQLAERIGALVDEELAIFASEGGIVNAALLDPIRVRLRSDIEEMLRDEIESTADGFVPEPFEREFEAVEVALGQSGSASFRGKIARPDVAKSARGVRVIDYKTGGHYWKRGEEWKGGRELQLALYNHAARRLFPDHEVAEAVEALGHRVPAWLRFAPRIHNLREHVQRTFQEVARAIIVRVLDRHGVGGVSEVRLFPSGRPSLSRSAKVPGSRARTMPSIGCKVTEAAAEAGPKDSDVSEVLARLRRLDLEIIDQAAELPAREPESGDGWPVAAVQSIRQSALAQAMSELRHRALLTEAFGRLAAADIIPVVFKGTALAYTLYPEGALRSRGDTDFIIPPGSQGNTAKTLTKLGFARELGISGESISYEASFTRSEPGSGSHTLDVHWRINNSELLSRLFTHAELLAHSQPVPALGSPCSRTVISCPRRARKYAQESPAGPPPSTATLRPSLGS